MSASNRSEPRSSLKRPPTVLSDHQGPCIAITCGSISGHLFLSKLDESKKAQGKCVLVGGKWYTPLRLSPWLVRRLKMEAVSPTSWQAFV